MDSTNRKTVGIRGTIPIALYELRQSGKLKKGDVLVLDAFGAGLTWGAVVYRW
jgi:3-oxoacyl-[acyl-carrier-protein] synthase III